MERQVDILYPRDAHDPNGTVEAFTNAAGPLFQRKFLQLVCIRRYGGTRKMPVRDPPRLTAAPAFHCW